MTFARLWLLLLLHAQHDSREVQGFGMNLIKVPDDDQTPIACTVGLLGKYFHSGETLSGSVVYVTTTSAARHLQKSLLQALHANTEYPWSIVISDSQRIVGDVTTSNDFILYEKPQSYFIVIESIEDEDMDVVFAIWKSTVNWNPLAQFVVFLSSVEETQEEMTDIMIEVLLIFMNKKIYNVNVIGQAEEDNFVYGKTVFPYHPDNNCGNRVITVETLDVCDYQVDKDTEEEDEEEEEEEDEEEEETTNEQEEVEVQEGEGEKEEGTVTESEVKDNVDMDEQEDQKETNETNETVNQEQWEVQNEPKEDQTENGKSLETLDEVTESKTESKAQTEPSGKSLKEQQSSLEEPEQEIESSNGNEAELSMKEPQPSLEEHDKETTSQYGSDTEIKASGKFFKESQPSLEEPNKETTNQNGSDAEIKARGKTLEEPLPSLEEPDDEIETQNGNKAELSGSDKSLKESHHSLEDVDNQTETQNKNEAELSSIKSLEELHEQIGVQNDSNEKKIGQSLQNPNIQTEVSKVPEAEETRRDKWKAKERGAEKEIFKRNKSLQQIDVEKESTTEKTHGDKSLQERKDDAKILLKTENSEAHLFPKGGNDMFVKNNKFSTKASQTLTVAEDGKVEPPLNSVSAGEVVTTTFVTKLQNLESKKLLAEKALEFELTSSSFLKEENLKVQTSSIEVLENSKSNVFSSKMKDFTQVEFVPDSNIKFPATAYPHHKSLPFSEDKEENKSSSQSKLYIEEKYRALFLDKFPRDLSGCPLIAAYRPWEPFIFNGAPKDADALVFNANNTMYTDEDADEMTSYDDQPDWSDDDLENPVQLQLNGIEYQMIQTIGEHLHISINLQVENTNVYQLFQQLIDGDIEMVIGGIDEDPIISQYVSSTIPYHQDDLTWCVAKARRSHNLFNFMTTFEPRAWILTILFILTASFSIRMSQKFLKFSIKSFKTYISVNMYIMGTILSQSINLPRLPSSLKLSFGTIFFMSLMFSNVYQSFLVSTLTTPKISHQISHTDEIYQRRMHVMGSVDNVRHLDKEDEIFRYVREQFQICYNIEECLQRAATDATLAVAVSRQHSFYNPRIPRDHLYCFDSNEHIYMYLVTMLLPKKFHLLHKINPVIQHIIESGHMQKWARDLDMRRKIIDAINRSHEEKFKSLTIGQVVGPFALYGFLVTIAAVVFALECMVYWLVVRRRTRLKLAKYLHRKWF